VGRGSGAADQPVRAVERAELDATGRLLDLEVTLSAGDGEPDTRIVLEPTLGRARISTRTAHVEWSVPADLPWIWTAVLTEPGAADPVSTPLQARVALEATDAARAVRLLDLATLTSHAMTSDQVAVSGSDGTTVVMADDAIDIRDGLPRQLHLAALATDVEPIDASKQPLALAAVDLGCAPISRFVAP
jgi:hypothetical protein